MSELPKLRQLLPKNQVEAWLNGFCTLDNSVTMAVVEPDGRVFARSDGWDEHGSHQVELSAADDSEGMTPAGSGHFPLHLAGIPLGEVIINSNN